MSAKRAILAAAVLAWAAAAFAATPRYTDLVLSDSDGGAAKATFKPDTPKVHLNTRLADIPPDAKIKAVWIATKVQGAPPDYKIDSTEIKVGKGMNIARFALSKPTAGWPTGDYRVELFIEDKPATQVKFKVAK